MTRREQGEREGRLHGLPGWRDSPFHTARERAALSWAEAVTIVHPDHVPDAVYENVRVHFSGRELVDLTVAVIAINGWTRLMISTRTMPEVDEHVR